MYVVFTVPYLLILNGEQSTVSDVQRSSRLRVENPLFCFFFSLYRMVFVIIAVSYASVNDNAR